MNPNESIAVPCGKCPQCVKRRVSGWSFRLMEESRVSSSCWFITLTYATTHVPITTNGFMALSKRDLQLFFKRLRKANPGRGLKYYAAGEYGGKTNRPHYHIILFNAALETIQPAWHLGQLHYGQVSEASVGYTLKYITKPSRIPMHQNDDRQPEFALMSKGLGASYLTYHTMWWHLDARAIWDRMYLTWRVEKKSRCRDIIRNDSTTPPNEKLSERISVPYYYKKRLLRKQKPPITIGTYCNRTLPNLLNKILNLLNATNYDRRKS